MNSNIPEVSVIIPSHNRADLVPRAVHSVLNQTFTDLECIVIDDASEDDTQQVVRSIDDDRLIYLRHETNRHASAARNTGIARAKGEFIAFLDDDDEWLLDKLEKQIALIRSSPDSVGMIYSWMDYFNERGELVKEVHPTLRGNVFRYAIDGQPLGGCPTLVVRRSVVEEVQGFDESLPRGNDGDFIRRVCLNYEVDLIPEVLVKVHIGHLHERISDHSEQGIRNAIYGHSIKLTKFRDQLKGYPRQTANIYANIAFHHGELGEWGKSLSNYRKAMTTHPFSPQVHSKMYISFKQFIKKRVLQWQT